MGLAGFTAGFGKLLTIGAASVSVIELIPMTAPVVAAVANAVFFRNSLLCIKDYENDVIPGLATSTTGGFISKLKSAEL